MNANLSSADRIIRVIIAAIFITLYLINIIPGTFGITLVVLSMIFLATTVIGFCPIYGALKISSLKRKKTNA